MKKPASYEEYTARFMPINGTESVSYPELRYTRFGMWLNQHHRTQTTGGWGRWASARFVEYPSAVNGGGGADEIPLFTCREDIKAQYCSVHSLYQCWLCWALDYHLKRDIPEQKSRQQSAQPNGNSSREVTQNPPYRRTQVRACLNLSSMLTASAHFQVKFKHTRT